MKRPSPFSPYSSASAAFGIPKAKPRRATKKRSADDKTILDEPRRQRSDKRARGGGVGRKGSTVTNITIGTPDAGPGGPFAAPPRAAGPVGPAPGAPPMGGGFKTGGKVAGAYPGSSGAAVNNTLARGESTGSDIRKWTAARKFTDRMTAGSLSGEGRLEKADHARRKK
jgi:hypothetical protein